MLDRFEAGFGRLLRFFAILVAISIGLFVVLIPTNLLMLRLGMGGIWWLYESIEYALYFGIFLGAPWVLQESAHVRVDVLVSALPQGMAYRLEQAMDLAGAALCATLMVYGLRAAHMEFLAGTMPDKDVRIANWIILSVFAASFFMLMLVFLQRFRRAQELAVNPGDSAGF